MIEILTTDVIFQVLLWQLIVLGISVFIIITN